MNGESSRQTLSERQVLDAIRAQLRPGERLLENIRFTDDRGGDVEVDALLLLPGLGAAVIEIKGGLVEFVDGEWTTSTATSRRRIRPTEQARNGKHALRSFLSRQASWSHELIRTEWFLAMPFTRVQGDMGPEAIREILIGADELTRALEIIRTRLESVRDGYHVPNSADVEDVWHLLRSQSGAPRRSNAVHVLQLSLFALAGVIITAACFVGAEISDQSAAYWLAALMAVGGVSFLGIYVRRRFAHFARDVIAAGVIAFLIGWIAGAPLANAAPIKTMRGCEANYGGCLPIVDDLDCADIEAMVEVTGEDVYRLDRDNDGKACEWNETPVE
ncbi:MAG: hypothetical protein RL441_485 [Actinomycetota bacterium]